MNRPHGQLVVGALVAAATLPVARLFQNSAGVGTILLTIVASTALAGLLRRARIVAPLSALISAAVFFWFAGLLFYRGDMLGPLPTPGMIEAVARGISRAIHVATVEVAPVDPTPQLQSLVAMAVWAAAWLADDAVFKMRHPLLAIGFVLPLFVFPGTLIASNHLWLDAGLFVAACLAVLFTDETSRLARWGKTAGYGTAGWKPGLAARIGAFIVVASVALAPLVPGYAREPGFVEPGGSGSTRIALNPILSIKPSLSDDAVTHLFTVTSPVASYWRVTALDQFDGQVWTAPPRRTLRPISGHTITPGSRGGRRVTQNIRIERLGGLWLPAAFEPIRVDRRANVTLESVSRSLLAPGLRSGATARITSSILNPTRQQLDAIDQGTIDAAPGLERYRAVPTGTPALVRSFADEVTSEARTPFEKALALQTELRRFTYDEDVRAGHSFETLEEFLFQVRRGYCEQFAGAMAVLARIAGLPSRVAIGFTVGNLIDHNTYQVTTRHAHAWVEIFFPGYGWLAFEPTPRSDSTTIVPSYARETSGGTAPATPGSPEASASPSPSPTGSLNPKLNADEQAGSRVPAPRLQGRGSSAGRALLVPAAILALAALLVPGAAAARRHLRRRHARDPRALALSYYIDFLDWCAAAGFPRRRGETPAEYARRLAERFAPAERPLEDLATLATGTLWGPDGHDGLVAEVARLGRAAAKAIGGALPVHIRVRPAVGWGWWRASGGGATRPLRP